MKDDGVLYFCAYVRGSWEKIYIFVRCSQKNIIILIIIISTKTFTFHSITTLPNNLETFFILLLVPTLHYSYILLLLKNNHYYIRILITQQNENSLKISDTVIEDLAVVENAEFGSV